MDKHRFYVNENAQANGDHEVHQAGCDHFPNKENATYLGDFYDCHGAVVEARIRGYAQANGCYYCATECHTQ